MILEGFLTKYEIDIFNYCMDIILIKLFNQLLCGNCVIIIKIIEFQVPFNVASKTSLRSRVFKVLSKQIVVFG